MVEAIKKFFGPTEVYVGTIEAEIDPIPGSDTAEGRAELAALSGAMVKRAVRIARAAQQAHVNA